jgi:hypothetical protein
MSPISPKWPNYTGVSQPVGTSPSGRVTVYVEPTLGQHSQDQRPRERGAEHLKGKNQRIDFQGADTLAINRADSFGIGVEFTERSIPNDPRR